MHYRVRPSNHLFQLFLTFLGRPEENSSYFSHVQPCTIIMYTGCIYYILGHAGISI